MDILNDFPATPKATADIIDLVFGKQATKNDKQATKVTPRVANLR